MRLLAALSVAACVCAAPAQAQSGAAPAEPDPIGLLLEDPIALLLEDPIASLLQSRAYVAITAAQVVRPAVAEAEGVAVDLVGVTTGTPLRRPGAAGLQLAAAWETSDLAARTLEMSSGLTRLDFTPAPRTGP